MKTIRIRSYLARMKQTPSATSTNVNEIILYADRRRRKVIGTLKFSAYDRFAATLGVLDVKGKAFALLRGRMIVDIFSIGRK